MFFLFESASGYSLFQRESTDEIALTETDTTDFAKFAQQLTLVSYAPFQSAQHALDNINCVSEGICHEFLTQFLEMNLPKKQKKNNVVLGISEKNLAGSVKQALGYDCVSNELVAETTRGLRLHAEKLLKQLKEHDMARAQLGLGHAYSRSKVKFNVNKSDNMIIQAISLVDQLDKDINTFAMRLREWYGWHFPELVKVVNDNHLYARLVKVIRNKSTLTEADLPVLEDIVSDPIKAQNIIDAARASMGTDVSDIDMDHIQIFAERVTAFANLRKNLYAYLLSKMHCVAPNLSALIGEVVGARLISHAGSLTNLCKYPASTVQILGAEKALFRALKTKGNTPKYGLIYHSSFIGRAAQKNKGRISRFLANKCSIASRIDCFLDENTSVFGEALKTQVEDRLKFYEEGVVPKSNEIAMNEAIEKNESMDTEELVVPASNKRKAEEETPKKKAKASKKAKATVVVEDVVMEEASPEKKKAKKSKKEVEVVAPVVVAPVVEVAKEKKQKKEKKSVVEEVVAPIVAAPVVAAKKAKKSKKE